MVEVVEGALLPQGVTGGLIICETTVLRTAMGWQSPSPPSRWALQSPHNPCGFQVPFRGEALRTVHSGASSRVLPNTCSLLSVDRKTTPPQTLILMGTQNTEAELIPREASGDSGSRLCAALTWWGLWTPRPVPPESLLLFFFKIIVK